MSFLSSTETYTFCLQQILSDKTNFEIWLKSFCFDFSAVFCSADNYIKFVELTAFYLHQNKSICFKHSTLKSQQHRPGTSIKVPDLGMSVKSPGFRGKPQNTALQWWGIIPHRGLNLGTYGAVVV